MADEYKIPVWKDGRENNGWAVIEHYLGRRRIRVRCGTDACDFAQAFAPHS